LASTNICNKFFYRGDRGDVSAWRDFESDLSSRLQDEAFIMIQRAGNEIREYLQMLKYEPVDYHGDENRIKLRAEPGFTLLKDSYFPYWSTEQDSILSTSQGFILVYTDDTMTLLSYRKPPINTVVTIISMISLATVVIVPAIGVIKGKQRT